MLDDYEEYTDQYVKFYKKSLTGDMNALAEYPALMQKATELQESMEKAQNDNQLGSSQIARMSRIQTKMLAGISGQ